MTAPIAASTNGSDVNVASALTQSAGRLKVGMPTATLGRPGAGTGAYQPAWCTVTLELVVMSNQIQPPSSNGSRLTSNSTETLASTSDPVARPPPPLATGAPPTVIRAPVALDR